MWPTISRNKYIRFICFLIVIILLCFAFEQTRNQFQKVSLPDEKDWLDNRRVEMERRKAHVKNICQSQNETVHWTNTPTGLVIVEDFRLSYCQQAKVGTNTILRYLLELANHALPPEDQLKIDDRIHWRLPRHFKLKEPIKKMAKLWPHIETFVNFSFVRHPFERLVSAFTNKVKDKKYKNLAARTKGNFTRFVDLVITDARKCKYHKECNIDVHWRPQYARCAYCDIPYFIGKMETFQEDMWFIANEADIVDVLQLSREDSLIRMNSSNHTKQSSSGLHQKTMELFSELNAERKKSLYEIYALDFLLFEYDPEPYVTIN